jgi:protein SCO1
MEFSMRTLASPPVRSAFLVALFAMACAQGDRARGTYAGVEMVPAQAKPNFTLTDLNERPYDFRASTDGHLTLLFFGYTHCPDVCPVHLANIAAVMHKLPTTDRARIRVVFVTTDPDRDSTAQLRSWLANFDTTFVGLRGNIDEVNRIETSLGLPTSVKEPVENGYGVGHAAQVLAFTADDSLRVGYPFGVRQQDWAADFPKLLAVRPSR